MSTEQSAEHLRDAVWRSLPSLRVPAPAMGATPERWSALFELARDRDVAVARLVEAHVDAVGILHEAGCVARPGALYGVWASVRRNRPDVELRSGSLRGTKSFCSGIGVVDRALVDVVDGGSRRLVDADVRTGDPFGSTSAPSGARVRGSVVWEHRGLVTTRTGNVEFDGLADMDVVAERDWYLDRVGFWHGALGPAACWAGAAAGLTGALDPNDDPHRTAALGSMIADTWAMCAVLEQAGREADAVPAGVNAAKRRALAARRVIHELAVRTADRFVRAAGPRPLVADAGVAQRLADLEIYLRQYHDERDLAALGGLGVARDG